VAMLIIRSAKGDETRTLAPGRLTIGREPGNGLVLEALDVSRSHAELEVRPEGVFLTDVGSRGGTFVGETRLLPQQPRQLQPGEQVRLGSYILIYLEDAPVPVQPDQDEAPAEAQPDTPEGDAGQPREQPEQPIDVSILISETIRPASVVPDDVPVVRALATRTPGRHLLAPHGAYSRYLRYLPSIFQDSDFLGRYLQIFETVWEPLEWRTDHIQLYFNPHTTPAPMIDWLAGWLDLAINEHWPEVRRRRLLAEATDLYRWRGTRYGMTRMIEVCTGMTPEVSDEPNTPFVFRVKLRIPADSGIDASLVEDLVRSHKPAHAGYVLEITE
jgi:phage tail-like protein